MLRALRPRGVCPGCRDRAEIESLLHAYARFLDAGRFDDFAELFRFGRWNGQDGYEGTLTWLHQNVRLYDGLPRTRHIVTGAQIQLQRDEATALSSIAVLHQPLQGGSIGIIACNSYRSRFVRYLGGWKFAECQVTRDLTGDMSGHLLHAALPDQGASAGSET